MTRPTVQAGLAAARKRGHTSVVAQWVAEHALRRHQEGDTVGPRRTWLTDFPDALEDWNTVLLAQADARQEQRECDWKLGPYPDGTAVRFTDEARAEIARGKRRTRSPRASWGGVDRVHTITNTPDNLHDAVLQENGERWACSWWEPGAPRPDEASRG